MTLPTAEIGFGMSIVSLLSTVSSVIFYYSRLATSVENIKEEIRFLKSQELKSRDETTKTAVLYDKVKNIESQVLLGFNDQITTLNNQLSKITDSLNDLKTQLVEVRTELRLSKPKNNNS